MPERKFFSALPRLLGTERTRVALKGVAGALWVMSISQSCQTQQFNDNLADAQRINVANLDNPQSRQIVLDYRASIGGKRAVSLLIAATEIAAGLFFLHIRPSKPL